jgi:Zinc finger C-x8-C-x5-C-x3-H type (and similar)
MSGIKKIGTENWQDRLQVGQSDRYGSYKEMVEAEAAAQNVRRLLKPAADTNELERQQEASLKMENQFKLYRELENARMDCATEYDRYRREGGEDNWEIYQNTEVRYSETKRRAEIGRAIYWTEDNKEEIRELRRQIQTLTKQRSEDNKGCGIVVQKILATVDRNCSDQIGVISGKCDSTTEILLKIMQWMDDKFRGDTSTIRAQIDKQIEQIPNNIQTIEEVQILISNVDTLRRKMQQLHHNQGGDPPRSDATFRTYIQKRLAHTMMELRIIISNIAEEVTWQQGMDIIDQWLAKQSASQQEQLTIEPKALSARADSNRSRGSSKYSNRDRDQSRDRDSRGSSKQGGGQQGVCWEWQRGTCRRGKECRFSHSESDRSEAQQNRKRSRSEESDRSQDSYHSRTPTPDRQRRQDTPKRTGNNDRGGRSNSSYRNDQGNSSSRSYNSSRRGYNSDQSYDSPQRQRK